MFRWLIVAVMLGALISSAYYRARARREAGAIPRRAEGRAFVALRVGVTLPLLLAIVGYVVAPARMAWASFDGPDWARWVGVGIGIAAVASVHWVLRALGRNVSETVLTKTHHELVTHGPYRWVRHPLYTTGLSLILAVGLMAESWLLLVLAGVVALGIRYAVIPKEEAALLKVFGERYREYMGRTGRLLPRG